MLNRATSLFTVRSLAAAATLILLAGAALPTIVAGNSGATRSAPGYVVPVYAGTSPDRYRPIPAPTSSQTAGGLHRALKQTSTIQVSYNGFTGSQGQKAKTAFQAAVDVWQSIIVSDQIIHVDANWVGLPNGVLGSAGPNQIYLENDNMWYPGALHEARCHCNDETTEAEIAANFNMNFSAWYLESDGQTPNNKWDFETVVLHELGHGLGFLSSFQQDGFGTIRWGFGSPRRPMRFDANEWDSKTSGHAIITQYANGSAALKSQVTDGSVFLGGTHLEAVLGGRGKLFAPSPWQGGSSNSHFDESKFAPGTVNALMTPVLNNGESIHDPGPATIAVFQDIGWTVEGGSDDMTPPVVEMPSVGFVAPQMMAVSVTVQVSWPDATDDSGISSYELQRQEGAGPWTSVALATPTSTSANVSVTRGSNYSFRVRATDGAANTGDWTTTSSAHVTTVQETPSSNLQYVGAWTLSNVSGAAGGKVEQSSTTNDTATFAFTGTSVAFVTTKAPARGIVEITLDSDAPVLVDLFAASKQAKRIVWVPDTVLSTGPHTVTIRVTGDTSGSSDRIDVDALLTWP